ncbi:hypothetical protein [Streptomyces hokutonensis]|uniref:hypothetical protein n=1 Tax=Streptomyces hokutonensis TaxID=1306990 RepID=UPI00369E2F95
MRYVELDGRAGEVTGVIDPRPYLAELAGFAELLPPGAREFATDPDHYDFGGRRCVKDLKPQSVVRVGDDSMEIRFGHNCWKHDDDLLVRYTGVLRFQADVPDVRDLSADLSALGDVILDEVLPAPGGCTHEIGCRPGTLFVACRDLSAEWSVADCPEARGGRGLRWSGDDPGS